MIYLFFFGAFCMRFYGEEVYVFIGVGSIIFILVEGYGRSFWEGEWSELF